ncbi:GNAT family N-acetyltransferase [Octadecabacter sp. G9-8]|uniref:GNAT family N-acetyltransferase n=1 Tax=Octadecabacter dasysiphoniae TaxID=2909341 RepID=A0ABS9D2H3_9RHOB|nr:GNAT family N-acetyltransferase [Octadecabacter dasysiphoniae]MCF2872835.1 GNAT family N-acetyltransferase [Octadecabacter dasysiphoniae]
MSVPLQQSPAFARALTAFGADVSCDAPVVLNRHIWPLGRIGFTSRGPHDTSDLRALRRDGLRIFNAEHDAPTPYKSAGFRQIITPAHIAEWELCATTDERRAALHPKWRNQLRRAEAAKLRLRDVNWDGMDHPLFQHADTTARSRRFRPLPTALIATFAQLNPEDALIFESYDKGHLIAAILVLRHGETATLQTAWTSPNGRRAHAHNLLLFHAADRLTHLGHKTFDLGLVETDNAPTLARFKLRTGAALRKLGGTWIAIPGL